MLSNIPQIKSPSVSTLKGSDIVIGIRDYGIGIPSSDLQRIRSPLFRAGNASSVPGAGLGLALVDRIVSVHKGRAGD